MQKKWIYIGLGVVAVGATIGFISYRNKKAVKDALSKSDNTLEGSGGSKGSETYEAGTEEQSSVQFKPSVLLTPTTMKIGSKGRPVALIQSYMNYKYGTNLNVDGRYGSELRDALRDKLGWYCGWYKMGDSTCTITSTESPAKDALSSLLSDAAFKKQFGKDYIKVAKEFEPVKWGGVNFPSVK